MPDTQDSRRRGRSPSQAGFWATGFFGVGLLLIFNETLWSMVSIWLRSDTFAHGFLILPISLWLVLNQRGRLHMINPKPAFWVALMLIPPGFVWLLACLVDVLVVQQLALVAMLVIGAWTILGHQLARSLAFPLLFLFFAVPMGEALIPPLMEFTAASTVWLVQQSGIPVYREGMYFSLPSGNWSVIEACSGSRYLIASFTLGVLYAYLAFRSFWRKLLFILASIIVPIIANSLRAYMIVMLGHISEMRLAVGMDHLVYGWVFFGFVMFLLFWLGSFFREDSDTAATESFPKCADTIADDRNVLLPFYASVFALLVATVWPLLAYATESRTKPVQNFSIALPEASGAWTSSAEGGWRWQPYASVAGLASDYYELNGQIIGLYVQYQFGNRESGEVIGSSRRFVDKSGNTRVLSRAHTPVRLGGNLVLADEAQLRGIGGELLAYSWYRVGDTYTSNDYLGKLLEAWMSLTSNYFLSCRIVIAAPEQGTVAVSRALLQDFLNEHAVELNKALQTAIEAGP